MLTVALCAILCAVVLLPLAFRARAARSAVERAWDPMTATDEEIGRRMREALESKLDALPHSVRPMQRYALEPDSVLIVESVTATHVRYLQLPDMERRRATIRDFLSVATLVE